MARKEPKVCTADVKRALWRAIRPVEPGKPSPNDGTDVEVLAVRADVSSRTIYRVLDEEEPYAELMKLDLADRLMLAADRHLSDARIVSCEEECHAEDE